MKQVGYLNAIPVFMLSACTDKISHLYDYGLNTEFQVANIYRYFFNLDLQCNPYLFEVHIIPF